MNLCVVESSYLLKVLRSCNDYLCFDVTRASNFTAHIGGLIQGDCRCYCVFFFHFLFWTLLKT